MPGMRRKVTFIKLKFFRIERRRRTVIFDRLPPLGIIDSIGFIGACIIDL
jgi:hypothetical protein